ncbi:MAG TPA: NAD(P)H-hydrate dehydratase, partial [Actinomycetota bacterium]|nr:NAD(P)H-hydrate dehydratase [Actinomycetota bacterium]
DLVRSDVLLVDEATVRDLLPRRGTDAHKRTSGVVLVVAGSARMTGAPTLVARGAYRAGAGLVHLLAPAEALPAIQPVLPEATYGTLPPTPDDIDLEAFDAIVIGPGLTGDPEIPAFVRRLVAIAPKPVVLDADGLNAFAGNAGEFAAAGTDLVLTPHTGEFARLFGMPVGEVLEDRIGIARKAAAETRATILLKGARSVIALPGGEVRINPTGSPALSTGGTGDVLAGAIGAYLARGGFAPEAATVGAYVHGLAGELLHEGALAGDVADALPVAIDRILR